MNRYEVLKTLVPLLDGQLTVCNIGAPSQELFALADQPSNFYMLGTMGLASSIGFGVAQAQDRPVVAIDGDGSVLTNLGSLATIANHPQDNFTLVIIDNAAYGSTGDQPTATAGRTSLAGVARACGWAKVIECEATGAAAALKGALARGRMSVIVVKCAPGSPKMPVIALHPVTIRDRFVAACAQPA